MKYTRRYFINLSIDLYGAASSLILGQAHVIFAAIKSATLRSPNLMRKGMLGFCSTTIPMAGRIPNLSSSNTVSDLDPGSTIGSGPTRRSTRLRQVPARYHY
jgi:hypothetical protein